MESRGTLNNSDCFNNKSENRCIGCLISSHELTPPGGIIVETKNFLLHQDPEALIKAFLIIASKKHIQSISQLPFPESQELFDLVYRARIALLSIEDIRDVTIIQEERSGHLHLWLFPRYDWMDKQFEYSLSNIRNIMHYAKSNNASSDNIDLILQAVVDIRNIMANP